MDVDLETEVICELINDYNNFSAVRSNLVAGPKQLVGLRLEAELFELEKRNCLMASRII